ncbi:hypothetical protein A3740_13930, partial [Oleiphilus sp. HI0068]
MTNLYKSVGLIIGVSLTAACSTVNDVPQTPAPQTAECNFDGTEKEAPNWVCTGVMGDLVTGRGSYDRNSASENLSFQIAQQRARADLARKLTVDLKAALSDYESITGSGLSERAEKHVQEIGQSELKMPLSGSRVYASVTDPNGVKYVLVGIDEELAKKNKKLFIKSSFRDAEAKWTKEEAK